MPQPSCEDSLGLLELLLGAVGRLLAALAGALQGRQLLLQLQALLPVLLPAQAGMSMAPPSLPLFNTLCSEPFTTPFSDHSICQLTCLLCPRHVSHQQPRTSGQHHDQQPRSVILCMNEARRNDICK